MAVGNDPVDVGGLQAGVLDRLQRCFELQGKRRAVRAALVIGLSNAGDGASLAQGHQGAPPEGIVLGAYNTTGLTV